jgi:hypothetical protein
MTEFRGLRRGSLKKAVEEALELRNSFNEGGVLKVFCGVEE